MLIREDGLHQKTGESGQRTAESHTDLSGSQLVDIRRTLHTLCPRKPLGEPGYANWFKDEVRVSTMDQESCPPVNSLTDTGAIFMSDCVSLGEVSMLDKGCH